MDLQDRPQIADPGGSVFQVSVGDFSGPLDLLCHLVESRAIDASSVKLTEVLSQYVSYMLASRRATLAELAEFFSLASRLLLRKVRSLMPGSDEPAEGGCGYADGDDLLEDDGPSEEELRMMLARFRPYRAAAAHLALLKEKREKSFVRVSDENGPPWFDIGDLHGLAALWWSLIDEYSQSAGEGTRERFMADIPDAVPEEVLIEQRMGDVAKFLMGNGGASLSALVRTFGGRDLIVTLLALLELSRLGRIYLRQEETWGDVEIAAV